MLFPWGCWLMRYETKIAIAAAGLALLAGCNGLASGPEKMPATAANPAPEVADYPTMLGAPYSVGTISYTPEDIPNYDEVGLASVYGADIVGKPTANGEIFAASAVSAAHKTMPLPSYVEVTALDTGRTIIVRVNDRGPMANDRLIALSPGAARQLGIGEQVAGVRVRRVNPPELERAALRSGQPASPRIDTPESLLKVLRDKLAKQPRTGTPAIAAAPSKAAAAPAKAVKSTAAQTTPGDAKAQPAPAKTVPAKPAEAKPAPTSPAAINGYVVQVAAFASRASAEALAKKLGANVLTTPDGKFHRVRYGPFASQSEAQAALKQARSKGYPQARLLRE